MQLPYIDHELCIFCGDSTESHELNLCDGCFQEEVEMRTREGRISIVVPNAVICPFCEGKMEQIWGCPMCGNTLESQRK